MPADQTRKRARRQTEVARALKMERKASQRLEELDALRNDFIALIAHDLRSPMSIATGFADMLVERWDELDDDTKRDYLVRISSSMLHLSSMLEDFFEVARAESGQLQCTLAPFDVTKLVQRTVADRASAHPDRLYVMDLEPDLPEGLGDEQRHWQILTNLLTNAAKFSPAGSQIDVSVQHAGDFVEITVQDNGEGIPIEDLPKLFQKFSRIKPSARVKGTGLGLFICRSLVEAQGGTIEAKSPPGGGARFTYTIPLA